MNQTRMILLLTLASFLVPLPSAGGSKQGADIPVSSYPADFDASNTPYYVQSDALGAYRNGVNGTTSILVANGYNHIMDGDWRLGLSSSTVRTIRVTFTQANAAQPGDPGYTAPANPPYLGTHFEAVRMENKCSMDNHDMLTMKAGDRFTCIMSIRFPPNPDSTYYRLDMAASWTFLNEPETQDVQISCNYANAGGCNDWFIDPVPVVNADGTTSPGETRARLNLVNNHGELSNQGDFYLTFHLHVTRP